ncbi:MAG: cysteine desulfurase [Candidatus Latescibacteria bacterium]|nr:cysteine desulfurase [Candidatus Latescibacterota bacterium]
MAEIYMDNAAGTRLLDEVYESMVPYMKTYYGNPSSIHSMGTEPREAINRARGQVASMIGAEAADIYFTSCGSESNNLAVKGTMLASIKTGRHVVVSAVEHQSVLNAARAMKRNGWDVTIVNTDNKGFVDPDAVNAAVRSDTVLVSVIHASNEIGTVEPIREIAKVVKSRNIPFHTDAVMTAGVIPVNVDDLGVDMLSLAANSFGGPKGAAALFIRKGVRVFSIFDGGIQERGRRAGTENVPAIVGLGKAAEMAVKDMDNRIKVTTALRDKLMNGLESKIPKLYINGDREKRLPGNVHASIEAIEGESILYSLARKGVMAASGSSCADKALKTSHVLTATGLDPALANASILFSLGFENTGEEIDHVLEVLPPIVERLRSMSPIWNG